MLISLIYRIFALNLSRLVYDRLGISSTFSRLCTYHVHLGALPPSLDSDHCLFGQFQATASNFAIIDLNNFECSRTPTVPVVHLVQGVKKLYQVQGLRAAVSGFCTCHVHLEERFHLLWTRVRVLLHGDGPAERGGGAWLLIRKRDHFSPARKMRQGVRALTARNHPGRFYPKACVCVNLKGPVILNSVRTVAHPVDVSCLSPPKNGVACMPRTVNTTRTECEDLKTKMQDEPASWGDYLGPPRGWACRKHVRQLERLCRPKESAHCHTPGQYFVFFTN